MEATPTASSSQGGFRTYERGSIKVFESCSSQQHPDCQSQTHIRYVATAPSLSALPGAWSQWPGLNRRPTVYETVALPLSYIGLAIKINDLNRVISSGFRWFAYSVYMYGVLPLLREPYHHGRSANSKRIPFRSIHSARICFATSQAATICEWSGSWQVNSPTPGTHVL